MNLDQQLDKVQTRDDLAVFVRSLAADMRANPDRWENVDLESFLEALSAWVEMMDQIYANRGESVPEKPDWKMFGEVLLAAAIYE